MFYKEKFAIILSKIKESYNSQEEFSKYSGVGRTYISQYINMKLESPPKPKILEKIANASKGLTNYDELMQICGYTNYMVDSFFADAIHQKDNRIPIVESIFFENNTLQTNTYGQYMNANFTIDNTKEYFAYKVNNDDMLPLLGVGDMAIIEKTDSFRNGQTCLFYIDNKDIMIRKIVDFQDYIELHTTFPYIPPIKLTKDEMKERNFTILGRVIKVENQSAFK